MVPSLALLYSTSTIKFFDFSQHFTGHQWFWDYSSLVPFTSEYNNMLFLATGGYSHREVTDLEICPALDFFYNSKDSLFKHPNLMRLMNPESFFNWQAFKDSKAQATFREAVLMFFNEYLINEKEIRLDFDEVVMVNTNRVWAVYMDLLDIYFYKTDYNFSFFTDESHFDHWDDFLHFVHYCYHFDICGFREFIIDTIPHFVIM